MLKDQLVQRINKLKTELEYGQKKLAEFDAKRACLQEWIPRITGVIQVLEEEMNKLNQPSDSNDEWPKTKSGTAG